MYLDSKIGHLGKMVKKNLSFDLIEPVPRSYHCMILLSFAEIPRNSLENQMIENEKQCDE